MDFLKLIHGLAGPCGDLIQSVQRCKMVAVVGYFFDVLQIFKLSEPHVLIRLEHLTRFGQNEERVVSAFDIGDRCLITDMNRDVNLLKAYVRWLDEPEGSPNVNLEPHIFVI